MTWQEFVEKWRDGCGNSLCQKADKIVLARGQIPCSVLFVGEAPGVSENSCGVPFVGPAGHLLDRIISMSLKPEVSKTFCNLVGCIPLGEDGQKVQDGPDHASIMRCKPRLEEFIQLCQPKIVVSVGKLSETYLDPKLRGGVRLPEGTRQVSILHPAYILRQSQAQQWLLIQRSMITLQNAVEELDG